MKLDQTKCKSMSALQCLSCSPATCLTMMLQYFEPDLQHTQNTPAVVACNPVTRLKSCCSWRAKPVWLGMQESRSHPRIGWKPHLLVCLTFLVLLKLAGRERLHRDTGKAVFDPG